MRENNKVIDTHNVISRTMFEPRVNYPFEDFNTIAVCDGVFLSGSAATTWCRFTGEALMMGVRNGAALLSPFLDRGTGPQRIKVTSCCSKRLSCLPSNSKSLTLFFGDFTS